MTSLIAPVEPPTRVNNIVKLTMQSSWKSNLLLIDLRNTAGLSVANQVEMVLTVNAG